MGFSAIHRKDVRPKFKYHVIYRHRNQYSIATMCAFFNVSRSGYYDYVKGLSRPNKHQNVIDHIRAYREHCDATYGYIRMWKWLKDEKKIYHNPKTILKIMRENQLLAEIRCPRPWRNMGEHLHKYENLLNRKFSAECPNSKWVTDISYIHTAQGVLYLSIIRDLYDNSIVAYKTSTKQTISLVLDTIHLAMREIKKVATGELQLHSDQGFQYTSQAYFDLTQSYNITPSMSRRGNCYDNAMAENFFGILKTECIYRRKLATFSQANQRIDRFIHFYNHERIQIKTGVAPLTLRHAC